MVKTMPTNKQWKLRFQPSCNTRLATHHYRSTNRTQASQMILQILSCQSMTIETVNQGLFNTISSCGTQFNNIKAKSNWFNKFIKCGTQINMKTGNLPRLVRSSISTENGLFAATILAITELLI